MDLKVKEELKRGLEAANQLRYLMAESRGQQRKNDPTSMAVMKDHSTMILEAFDTAISILKNGQLDRRNNYMDCTSDYDNSVMNVRKTRSNRRTSQPQPIKEINTSMVTEDGYYWRKYGQKPIVKSMHPREYYKCGHSDQGCQATKQVQMTSENPIKNYKIVYYGHHTCQHLLNNNPPQFDSLLDTYGDKEDPNMLSFENPNNTKQGLDSPPSNISSSSSNARRGMQSVPPLDQGSPSSSLDPTTIIEPHGTGGYPSVFCPYKVMDYSHLMEDYTLDGVFEGLDLWEDQL